MSTKVLLLRHGLEQYYEFFQKAGYKLVDGKRKKGDSCEKETTTEKVSTESFAAALSFAALMFYA
jgi:hypothetical protein